MRVGVRAYLITNPPVRWPMTAQLEETRLGVPPLLFLTKDGASRAPGRVVVRSAPVPTGPGAPQHDADPLDKAPLFINKTSLLLSHHLSAVRTEALS